MIWFVCRFDRRKQKKITDFCQHHLTFIEEWDLDAENVHDNDELHNNNDYSRYQAWYQGATRCKLRQQWTADDYADNDSSDDEDTEYDQSTRLGNPSGGDTHLGSSGKFCSILTLDMYQMYV
jgi:hypothetical protein